MGAADFLNLFVSAMLLTGIYAAMSVGMTVIYGVMKIVNLAHAGFLMLGAYFVMELYERFGVDPLAGAVLAFPAFFVAGVLVHWLLVKRIPDSDQPTLASLLLMFGLWLVLQNFGYLIWGNSDRSIRALMQNRYAGRLVGIPVEKTARLTFGVGIGFAGSAGGLLALLYSFSPDFGRSFLLRSFVIIVLGGLESFWGTAVGAIILALVETFSILVLPAGYQPAIAFSLLVLALVVLPGGVAGVFAKKHRWA